MPDLRVLDSRHAIYASHEQSWRREERRLAGSDAILSELVQFGHEEDSSFTARQAWARWLNFARVHTTVLAGHLTKKIPVPNYGKLGEVRQLGDIQGKQSFAELYQFNCNGVGTDGLELHTFMDGVQQRAMATGFRWLMEEMPTRETLRAIRVRLGKLAPDSEMPEIGKISDDEIWAGFRPFRVEYSPLSVTNWRYLDGVLQWAVVRIPIEPLMDFTEGEQTSGLGYYLLVRQGYRGLGEDYEQGGWWKYDSKRVLVDEGRWGDTDGQIPMWQHVGEPGNGTYERPSIGTSSTMELGQISADLMNAVSEQRFNLRQAAKSTNYFMGIDKDAHDSVVLQQGDGSISIGVPAAKNPDGTYQVPTLQNSSACALDAAAYSTVIDAAKAEAKETMVRQIVAAPDASGARVEAEHESATVPMLSRMAGTAQSSWNTGLYFTGRRFGLSHEEASAMSVAIARDFKLREIIDSIDQLLDTMTKAGVSSATLTKGLVIRKAEELDLLPEEDREQVEEDLGEGSDAALNRSKLQAEVVKAWLDAGASEAGAAQEAGVSEERVAVIFGTPNPMMEEPDIAPVPGQAA